MTRRDHQDEPAARKGPRGYSQRLKLSALALLWERLWPALWPPLGFLGLFIALALLGVPDILPPWLHAAALLIAVGAFGLLTRRALYRLQLPIRTEAQRRLERDSGLDHRPLAGLEDRLVSHSADSATGQLWEAHRRRLLEEAADLRVSPPRTSWLRVDRYALRAAVGLLLVIGIAVGGADWQSRLARAVSPDLHFGEPPPPPSLDIWLSPPAYTGQPPRYLDPEWDPSVTVRLPAGSRVLAQVDGGRGVPNLRVDDEAQDFETLADHLYRSEVTLTEGRRLAVEQDGLPLASWALRVEPDLPPEIEYLQAPARAARGALQVMFAARDDYGLERARMLVERLDHPEAGPLDFDLPLPGKAPRDVEVTEFRDLTAHPWAGIPVGITLEVEDALGQRGRTETFETVLPERTFNHPVARALVEQRKRLTLEPQARSTVARNLAAIGENPAHYFYDVVVSLAIRSAERRLLYDRRQQAIREVQSLLWDTALHIEDGGLALAERDLREAQQRLLEALDQDASSEEIERLMDELQAALDRFLDALVQQAMEQMRDRDEQAMPSFDDFELMESRDLQDMIEQARELARSGAREQAREMLSQLQRMLENLQAMPMGMEEFAEQLRQSREMMDGLEDIMRRQQELLDESFRQSQPGESGQQPPQPGGPQPESSGAGADAQEGLRRQLGQLMRRFGEMTGDIPRPLGQAERHMSAARDALRDGQPGQAVQPQTDAIDQLQQGMEAMLQDFMQQLGQGEGEDGQLFGGTGRGDRDPLGRRRGGPGFYDRGDDVDIPDADRLQRSREILDELRTRRSQPYRPRDELEYLDRLLRQF